MVRIKIMALWDVMPCSLVDTWKMEEPVPPKCWHLSAKLHSVISQETVILSDPLVNECINETRFFKYIFINLSVCE